MSRLVLSLLADADCDVIDAEKVRRLKEDTFHHLRLHDAVGVRPSVLRFILPLDDAFLRETVRQVSESNIAGLRVGQEWLPTDAKLIEKKDVSDNHWSTHEDLKPLNDVCTKWCTKKYFPDAFWRVNMVANVIRLYDRLRELSGLKFNIVFKGGVMVRMVLLEFLSNLPLSNKRRVIDFLNEHHCLSISDLDFEIVPEDHASKEEYVHKFFLLDYAVLLWLQNVMQKEVDGKKEAGLLSLDWEEEEGNEELKSYLQEAVNDMNESSAFHGATIDRVVIGGTDPTPLSGYRTKDGKPVPAPRRNVVIFDCENTKCVMHAAAFLRETGVRGVPATSGGRHFYATLNTYIGEEELLKKSRKQTRADFWPGLFHLARIKHAFIVYYTTKNGEKRCDRLGGEMIDMSQSHNVAKDAIRRHLYKAIPHPYMEYPIVGVGTKVAILRSYTTHGFMFDHKTMIFNTEKEPWDITKRDKRVVRFLAFLFAYVFSPAVRGSIRSKRACMMAFVEQLGRTSAKIGTTGIPVLDDVLKADHALPPSPKKREFTRRLHTLCKTLHLLAFQSFNPNVLDEDTLREMNRLMFEGTPRHTMTLQEQLDTTVIQMDTTFLRRGLDSFDYVNAFCKQNGFNTAVLEVVYLHEWYVLSALQNTVTGAAYEYLLKELISVGVLKMTSRQALDRNEYGLISWGMKYLSVDLFGGVDQGTFFHRMIHSLVGYFASLFDQSYFVHVAEVLSRLRRETVATGRTAKRSYFTTNRRLKNGQMKEGTTTFFPSGHDYIQVLSEGAADDHSRLYFDLGCPFRGKKEEAFLTILRIGIHLPGNDDFKYASQVSRWRITPSLSVVAYNLLAASQLLANEKDLVHPYVSLILDFLRHARSYGERTGECVIRKKLRDFQRLSNICRFAKTCYITPESIA